MQHQSTAEPRVDRNTQRPLILAAAAAPIVVVLDQISKAIIWNIYGPAGHILESEWLGGLVRLHFVRNTGSAFGMFQGQSSLLTVATFIAIGFLGVFFIRNARDDSLVALSLGLLIGGAIGNLIDRIRLGYVIDWIRLPVTLSFNVADAAITVGMVLLFVAILFRDSLDRARPEQPGGGQPEVAGLTSLNED